MGGKQANKWTSGLIIAVIMLAWIIPAAIVVKNRVVTLTSTTLKDAVVVECTYKNMRRKSAGYTSKYTPVAITPEGEKATGTLYSSGESSCTRMIGLKTSIYVNSDDHRQNRIGSFIQFWLFPFLILFVTVVLGLSLTRAKKLLFPVVILFAGVGAILFFRERGALGFNKDDTDLASPQGQFDACVTKHLNKADLDGRSQLKKLECYPMPDVSVLSGFPNLEEVYIASTSFTSITELSLPSDLRVLRINNANLLSLEGLDRFTQLESLSFANVQFDTLQKIPVIQSLKKLSVLSNGKLQSLNGVARFQNLEELKMERNAINDITEIAQLPQLKIIYLHAEPLVDLSPLKGLMELEVARFQYSQAKDFSPLFNKPKMKHPGATGSGVPCGQMSQWMGTLEPKRRKFMWLPKQCKHLEPE